MRILLSTIGSRGDVEPVLALAIQLKALAHDVHICAPPDFRDWIDSLGIAVTPIGPMLRPLTATSAPILPSRPSPERLQQLATESVATQFATITEAARGCDVVLAAGALQVAARSVTEILDIRYVFAAYCPIVLPSPHHAPPPLTQRGQQPPQGPTDNLALWAKDAERFTNTFGAALNTHRAAAGLAPVSDVRSHIYGDQPWLAADPTLAPWPENQAASPSPSMGEGRVGVMQTGAWIRPDDRPLSPELEAFLDTGEPPVYLGLGSMRAPAGLSQAMIEAARKLGRRALLSTGWADLSLVDDGPDCLSIGEVNQQALFQRVAAVVHHGGAGTTTTAARAGAPQVVIPQNYDQFYWAARVEYLGIGMAHEPVPPTADSLAAALNHALQPDVAARAQSLARRVRIDGALIAARRLVA